jgi:hypothetical protein
MTYCDAAYFGRLDTRRDPLLRAIVACILARRITHNPHRSDAINIIGMRTASHSAVSAHEHFDREFELPLILVHQFAFSGPPCLPTGKPGVWSFG